MIGVSVKSDIDKTVKRLRNVEKRTIQLATNRTLNRTGAFVFTRLIRSISKAAGAKQKDLKKRFTRTIKSTFANLEFIIHIKAGAIPLKDFSPRKTKAGVTAKAWGKSKLYQGAFIAGGGLGRHVYKRVSSKRLPIEKLWGPQPSKIAMDEAIESETKTNINNKFLSEFDANLKYYLAKQK